VNPDCLHFILNSYDNFSYLFNENNANPIPTPLYSKWNFIAFDPMISHADYQMISLSSNDDFQSVRH
jgi:hypothetical protein